MSEPPVYSIGYGNRNPTETIQLVLQAGCAFLIDVRSSPYSKYSPQYNREEFEKACHGAGLKYVFMGDHLGGRPHSPDCYDADGKVNYQKVECDHKFLAGVARVELAISKGIQVAVMCSELRPEECHRTKLIGKVLTERSHVVHHVDADGTLISHDKVLLRLTGGQEDFFGQPELSRSRGTYKAPNP